MPAEVGIDGRGIGPFRSPCVVGTSTDGVAV